MPSKHYTSSDSDGNIREIPRKETGQLEHQSHSLPFPALVTAWYPKSQTIAVNMPTRFGQTVSEIVVVYGDFFQSTGVIRAPKIAVTLGEDGYSTVREPDQKNPASGKYVLDNNIEALVFKTSFGYAASSFRFLTADSSMLNNVKPGRKIVRHDDGSYYIHDDDGNMQFKHPSGLNIKAGFTLSDIFLEDPFPPHEQNVIDYGGTIQVKVEHPLGSIVKYDGAGLLEITGPTGKNLKTIIDSFIDEVAKIIVLNGTSPDVNALNLLKADLLLLLK